MCLLHIQTSQSRRQMSEWTWRPSAALFLNSGNAAEELVASVGAMHPHHLYVLMYSLKANIVCRWTLNWPVLRAAFWCSVSFHPSCYYPLWTSSLDTEVFGATWSCNLVHSSWGLRTQLGSRWPLSTFIIHLANHICAHPPLKELCFSPSQESVKIDSNTSGGTQTFHFSDVVKLEYGSDISSLFDYQVIIYTVYEVYYNMCAFVVAKVWHQWTTFELYLWFIVSHEHTSPLLSLQDHPSKTTSCVSIRVRVVVKAVQTLTVAWQLNVNLNLN